MHSSDSFPFTHLALPISFQPPPPQTSLPFIYPFNSFTHFTLIYSLYPYLLNLIRFTGPILPAYPLTHASPLLTPLNLSSPITHPLSLSLLHYSSPFNSSFPITHFSLTHFLTLLTQIHYLSHYSSLTQPSNSSSPLFISF